MKVHQIVKFGLMLNFLKIFVHIFFQPQLRQFLKFTSISLDLNFQYEITIQDQIIFQFFIIHLLKYLIKFLIINSMTLILVFTYIVDYFCFFIFLINLKLFYNDLFINLNSLLLIIMLISRNDIPSIMFSDLRIILFSFIIMFLLLKMNACYEFFIQDQC